MLNIMNAILFPGQGSQIVGMGSEFYNKFEIVKKIFKEADEKLNFKISKIILISSLQNFLLDILWVNIVHWFVLSH